MTESTEQTTPTNGGGLASLKLAQLQALASQLGIAGGSRMRKADLVTAISDHQPYSRSRGWRADGLA